MKEFNYYYDEEKNTMYVPREILELARKEKIEIEAIPRVINNTNCYSIHYKELKKLEEKLHFQGKEIKISTKKKKDNIIIVYKLTDTDELYSTEDIFNEKRKSRTIMGRTCYETCAQELETFLGMKFIIVTVYSSKKDNTKVEDSSKDKVDIIVCSYNDVLFIEEDTLKNLGIKTIERQKIKVNGILYVETIPEEIEKVKDEVPANIVVKDIVPKTEKKSIK